MATIHNDAALDDARERIQAARGKRPADLVFRNGQVVNVFSNEVYEADVAVYAGCWTWTPGRLSLSSREA